MAALRFWPVDPFSYRCQLDGEIIGTVAYSPSVYHSWSFRNTQGNVVTYGSTKYQAVKLYVAFYMGMEGF